MDLTEEYKYLEKGCQDDGARLFGGAQQQDKRQWAQTETKEIPMKYKRKLFFCVGGQTLEKTCDTLRYSRDTLESPSLQIFKTQLDTAPNKL